MAAHQGDESIRVYEVIDDDDDDDCEPVQDVEQRPGTVHTHQRTLGKRKDDKQKDAPNVKRHKTPKPSPDETKDESAIVCVTPSTPSNATAEQQDNAEEQRHTGTTERATGFGKVVDVWLESGEWPNVTVHHRNNNSNVMINCGSNFMCAGIGGGTVIINGCVVSGGRYVSSGGTVNVGHHVVPFDVNQVPCLYIEGSARDVRTLSGDVVVWGRSDNIITTSGDVEVDGNAMDLKTLSGDIKVRRRSRPSEDQAALGPPENPSGNLLVHVHGAVRDINTGPVDVHVDGKVNALTTVSGDVEIGGDAKDITTTSGDITVRGRCRNKVSTRRSGCVMNNVSLHGMTFGNIIGGRFG